MIYIVVTPFWPHDLKVHGSYIWDQVSAIARTGEFSKVFVFVPEQRGMRPCGLDFTFAEVHTFKFISMPSYFFNGILNLINLKLLKRAISKVFFHNNEEIVLHVHTSGFRFGLDALPKSLFNVTKLLHHHDLDPYNVCHGNVLNNRLSLCYRALNARVGIESADINICISKRVAENIKTFPAVDNQNYYRYIARLLKIQSLRAARVNNIMVLHNGVDLSKFNVGSNLWQVKKFEYCIDAGLTIGCVANFIELKDHFTLLLAVANLKREGFKIELRLLGQGYLKDILLRNIEALDIENCVKFHDEMENCKMVEFYRSIDLFVLPSVFEGFGCVLFESVASGVPFIACRNQGVDEFFDGLGSSEYLFNPGDFNDLTVKIKRFINNDVSEFPINISDLDFDVIALKFVQMLRSFKSKSMI